MQNKIEDIPKELLPAHIGIIMDGNGRWAKKRLLPRTAGHVQGVKSFRKCADRCSELGIKYVTFYAFSTENWKRPKQEVDTIMKLFSDNLDEALTMDEKSIRLCFIGDRTPLPEELRKKMDRLERDSAKNSGTVCTLAINYGGRGDIAHAVKSIISQGIPAESITEDVITERLYTAGMPDVDLIIRPSGEQRLSNFMIWQAAYAEYVFMDVLWPDFGEKELDSAILEFCRRNRRFGGL